MDGAAFNFRGGNNSIDIAASYLLTSFVQLTGDHRGDLLAAWGSVNPQINAWIGIFLTNL